MSRTSKRLQQLQQLQEASEPIVSDHDLHLQQSRRRTNQQYYQRRKEIARAQQQQQQDIIATHEPLNDQAGLDTPATLNLHLTNIAAEYHTYDYPGDNEREKEAEEEEADYEQDNNEEEVGEVDYEQENNEEESGGFLIGGGLTEENLDNMIGNWEARIDQAEQDRASQPFINIAIESEDRRSVHEEVEAQLLHELAAGSGTQDNGSEFELEDGSGEEQSIDSDEAPVDDLDYTVAKLFSQLLGDGFHGCTEAEHEAALSRHNGKVTDTIGDHYSLRNITDLGELTGLPSVLSQDGLLGEDVGIAEEVPKPTSEQWKMLFEGIPIATQRATGEGYKEQRHRRSPSSGRSLDNSGPSSSDTESLYSQTSTSTQYHDQPQSPMYVCLHQEETSEVAVRTLHDIDSFLGFAGSLAVARKGLRYVPVTNQQKNIKTDVHLEKQVFLHDEDAGDGGEPAIRAHQAMIRDIPHLQIGHVDGYPECSVYVIFPHLQYGTEKFEVLSHEQQRRWTDGVFLRVLRQRLNSNFMQHVPASFDCAYQSARSGGEARRRRDEHHQRYSANGYLLQHGELGGIWDDVTEIIENEAGFGDFRGAYILVNAKGTKLRHRSRDSLASMCDVLEQFKTFIGSLLDLEHLQDDQLYIDIGKEVCPVGEEVLRRAAPPDKPEPQTLLWKRCCLEKYMKWMYDEEPPSAKGTGQRYYGEVMLHDGCNMTSVSPKKSALRRGGLVYSQFYGSHKELFDARKIFPFTNDALDELAIDRRIMQAIRSIDHKEASSTSFIRNAYLASKKRVATVLGQSAYKSFGVREEHRVSWRLYKALLARVREDGDAGAQQRQPLEQGAPRYVWPVRTESWLRYLGWSANKFAAGFEITRASCVDVITWERTKLMAMFLRGLRFCLQSCLTGREPALWYGKGRHQRSGRAGQVWYGLGFSETLQQYGHCWLRPRVDWQTLTFSRDVADRIRFGNALLANVYQKQSRLIRNLFSTTDRIQIAVELVGRCSREELAPIRSRLVDWLAHICLQQFRQDVLLSAKQDFAAESQREIAMGTTPFCYRYVKGITSPPGSLRLADSCRDFKEPLALARRLFDFHDHDDGKRVGWVNKPFRKIYEQIFLSLQRLDCGVGHHRRQTSLQTLFEHRTRSLLFQYHWLLPYPSATALARKYGGRRVWYAIRLKRFAVVYKAESWEWARDCPIRSRAPPPLPDWLTWSGDEWRRWVEDCSLKLADGSDIEDEDALTRRAERDRVLSARAAHEDAERRVIEAERSRLLTERAVREDAERRARHAREARAELHRLQREREEDRRRRELEREERNRRAWEQSFLGFEIYRDAETSRDPDVHREPKRRRFGY